jgi:PEP-CTERM motif-containing protein
MKRLIISLTIVLSMFLLQSNSHATAIADLEVILDWSRLEISADPSSTLPPPFSQYKGLSSEGWVNGDPMTAAYAHTGLHSADMSDTDVGWNDVSLTNGIGANSTSLTTTDDLLSAHSISSSSSNSDSSGWINGNVHRSMEFIPQIDATYTFALNYEISSLLSRDNHNSENASNGGLVHLMLYWHEYELGVVDDWHLLDEQRNDLSYSLENQVLLSSFDDTGILSATASLLAGEIYSLGTHHGVSSFTRSIPEPGTILLFGLGIAGLIGSRVNLQK